MRYLQIRLLRDGKLFAMMALDGASDLPDEVQLVEQFPSKASEVLHSWPVVVDPAEKENQ